MIFIEEKTIDLVAEAIGSDEQQFQTALKTFHEEQPIFLAFLFSENFETLFQPEREYLLFIILVIYEATKNKWQEIPSEIDELSIEIAEEKNWETMATSSAKIFRARIDPFFVGYPQEDLLAFVEDALADDEDTPTDFISKESREALFITAKTLIDCLQKATF